MTLAIILIILNLIIIILEPVPEAVYYLGSVIILPVVLFVIWTSRWISATDFFYNKLFRLWVVPFIISAIFLTALVDWDAELVHVYRSLFSALSNGQNPYLDPVIHHRLADGSVTYSRFNYPPGEIPLYLLVYTLLNEWNYGVIIFANLLFNVVVALVFIIKTPDLDWDAKLPYVILLIVSNLHNSVSTTFLSIMMASILLLDMNVNPTIVKRIGLILAISLGLLAKFFMIPFAAIYFWDRIVETREWSYFIDAAVILSIVLLIIWPFGWFNVVQSSVLFNLDLSIRAEVTTYFFNPISSLFYFLDIKILYAPFVIILFLTAIIATRHLSLLNRVVLVLAFCLLLFPTPENQFVGSVLGLLTLSKVNELRCKSPSIEIETQ
ncbi:MAG: hypothetical protein ACE5I5_08285 [Candidatus Heimdallarchaeota archaeon]